MQLNALKTELVSFSKHANPGNLKMWIKVGEETVHAGTSLKYLGKSLDKCQFNRKSKQRLGTWPLLSEPCTKAGRAFPQQRD